MQSAAVLPLRNSFHCADGGNRIVSGMYGLCIDSDGQQFDYYIADACRPEQKAPEGYETITLRTAIVSYGFRCKKIKHNSKRSTVMELLKCVKEAFTVIGKEGSTKDGEGFIQRLWEDANSHFHEVAHLAKKREDGSLAGIWGAMSDFSRSFLPWEDGFSKGLYLAGVECGDHAEPPAGWTKWVIPGYEYIYVENENDGVFSEVLGYLQENGIPLAGAVHDFNCPETGKPYLFFPVRRL